MGGILSGIKGGFDPRLNPSINVFDLQATRKIEPKKFERRGILYGIESNLGDLIKGESTLDLKGIWHK